MLEGMDTLFDVSITHFIPVSKYLNMPQIYTPTMYPGNFFFKEKSLKSEQVWTSISGGPGMSTAGGLSTAG